MKRSSLAGLSSCLGAPPGLIISRKPPFPRARTQSRILARSLSRFPGNSGLVSVHQVSVRARRFTWKKLITTVLGVGLSITGGILVIGLSTLDDEDFDESDGADLSLVAEKIKDVSKGDKLGVEADEGLRYGGDGANKHAPTTDSAQEEEQDDADFIPDETPENAWFIPLGRVEKMPSKFYKSTDPEWQEMVKFSRDTKRKQRMVNEFVEDVRKELAGERGPKNLLGKDVKCWRRLVWVEYPPAPVREYAQLGIEWSPDYIALLHRTKDPINAQRTQSALWPDVVGSSAYSTIKQIFADQYKKAYAKVFGSAKGSENSTQPLGAPVSMQASPTTPKEKLDKPSVSLSIAGAKTDSSDSWLDSANLLSILPDYPPRDDVIAQAIGLFRRDLASKWKRPTDFPRGSVLLRGMLEYGGSKGVCVLEIVAVYSVMDNRFYAAHASFKNLRPWKARPIG